MGRLSPDLGLSRRDWTLLLTVASALLVLVVTLELYGWTRAVESIGAFFTQ